MKLIGWAGCVANNSYWSPTPTPNMHELTAPMRVREENGSSLDYGMSVGLSLDGSHSEDGDTLLVDPDVSHQQRKSFTNSSAKINWSLAYSSDEDSQKSLPRRLQRSCSDPSMRDSFPTMPGGLPFHSVTSHQGPRQRSRSSCSHHSEEDAPLKDNCGCPAENDSSSRSLRPDNENRSSDDDERKGKNGLMRNSFLKKSTSLCTPLRFLSVLFVLTCYTTFWLPYPGVKPPSHFLHQHAPKQLRQPPTTSIPHATLPRSSTHNPPGIAQASPSLFHARAPPEVELNFNKYRPGLERYYEQEGFSNRPWTRDINLLALGMVLIFLVWEQSRRGGGVASSSDQQQPQQQVSVDGQEQV